MSRRERRAVERVHDACDVLLWAIGHAETYIARIELANAIADLVKLSEEARQTERRKDVA